MIVIIFGLAASGKTYIGKLLGNKTNFHHIDADAWLTNQMKNYVLEQKHFTLEMLDEFTQEIISNIEKLQESFQDIIISQALYRTVNRNAIMDYFTKKNQEIIFIQVEVDDEVILKRLIARGDWVSPEYASSMKQYFQPMPEAFKLNNNNYSDEEIISQFNSIIKNTQSQDVR